MTNMPDLTLDDDAKKALLERSRRIAVVGASADPTRDSNHVFGYLKDHGYGLVPVTPKPDRIHGVEPVADLAAARKQIGEIDIVDVFRKPDAAETVVDAAVAVGAKAVWFQFGTDHPDAVRKALDAGLDVVADRCIKVEHQRLFGVTG